YLSDGITDSLIFSLSQLPKLRVTSHTTAFRYKGRGADPAAVGRELNVRAVLTGSIAQRGDEIYITIELADARDNTSIWGKQYNRKLAGIVTLQEEITRDVSENLRLRLGAEDRKRLTQRYTENFEANLLYLKGRSHWNKHTKDSLKD